MLEPWLSSLVLSVMWSRGRTRLKSAVSHSSHSQKILPCIWWLWSLWFLRLCVCVLSVLNCVYSGIMCLAVLIVTAVPSVWDLDIKHLTVGLPARMHKGRGPQTTCHSWTWVPIFWRSWGTEQYFFRLRARHWLLHTLREQSSVALRLNEAGPALENVKCWELKNFEVLLS